MLFLLQNAFHVHASKITMLVDNEGIVSVYDSRNKFGIITDFSNKVLARVGNQYIHHHDKQYWGQRAPLTYSSTLGFRSRINFGIMNKERAG